MRIRNIRPFLLILLCLCTIFNHIEYTRAQNKSHQQTEISPDLPVDSPAETPSEFPQESPVDFPVEYPLEFPTEVFSEGSPFKPIEITVDSPHFGSVGPGETSYYTLSVEKRSDLYIEVSELDADALLIYYGQDPTFEEWVTMSEGTVLMVEDYFVEPGSRLYFTVELLHEEQFRRITFKITVTEDFILSPVGIGMHGAIFTDAYELKPGNTYLQTVSADGLNYYKTVVENGPHLRIVVDNLPEYADLLWFDIQTGSYSRAYSLREEGMKKLEIYDLSPGSICLYYMTADPSRIEADSTFTVSISEFYEQ